MLSCPLYLGLLVNNFIIFFDPQVSSSNMLVIFVYKIRAFTIAWQKNIILKRDCNI